MFFHGKYFFPKLNWGTELEKSSKTQIWVFHQPESPCKLSFFEPRNFPSLTHLLREHRGRFRAKGTCPASQRPPQRGQSSGHPPWEERHRRHSQSLFVKSCGTIVVFVNEGPCPTRSCRACTCPLHSVWVIGTPFKGHFWGHTLFNGPLLYFLMKIRGHLQEYLVYSWWNASTWYK